MTKPKPVKNQRLRNRHCAVLQELDLANLQLRTLFNTLTGEQIARLPTMAELLAAAVDLRRQRDEAIETATQAINQHGRTYE